MLITAIAPIRVADVGGWTDTWFAGHGAVCNIAVYPYVEVQVAVHERDERHPRVAVHAENYGLRFAIEDLDRAYDKLPLLEAALQRMAIPERQRLEVTLHCEVPPGASTGTSAAVSVAIIAALDQLTPGRLTPYEIARLAHHIEAEDLGLQSGIQDQLCSAYGGINLIQMHAFPHASVSPVSLGQAAWWELERRLALIYVGKPHQSSAMHSEVIQHLGSNAAQDPRLERLRHLAIRAKDALAQHDWAELGATWESNTEAQRDLHPGLICADFDRVISLAHQHGAAGCKVNGAGGDGGSVTVLCGPRSEDKRALLRAAAELGFTPIPLLLARQGLRIWSAASSG